MSERIIARPFLAVAATDAEIAATLAKKGELMAFVKIDGVRGTNIPRFDGRGEMRSRTMKVFPNQEFNRVFGIPELRGLDGEIAVKAPNDPALCRLTSGALQTVNRTADDFCWYVFDDPTIDAPFHERHRRMTERVKDLRMRNVHPLKAHTIRTMDDLRGLEERAVNIEGFEGLILRDPNAPYKEGRSTMKEGFMLKVKRFVDAEGIIEDYVELESNQNEAFMNELGLTSRSSAKSGKVGAGVLGAFIVREEKTGAPARVGTGFTAQERLDYWEIRDLLIGRRLTFKHLPVGGKERFRHTSFVTWRDPFIAG